MARKDDDCRVVVAVKLRPLSEQELADGCQSCVFVTPDQPQVSAGPHSFTYDYVFGEGGSEPDELVTDCIEPLLDGLFNGYNATVFAYGQTGSGKTYTMGSAYTPGGGAQGVIPWVIDNLFSRISKLKDVDSTVRVSFVEIHKEEVRDLLYTGAARARPAVTIREVLGSGVVLAGATEKEVRSCEETASVLEQGTLCRATGATNMNNRSSRSHAVFTITLEQRRLAPGTPKTGQRECGGGGGSGGNGANNNSNGEESDDDSVVDDGDGVDSFLCAKMHLVDLAGSERAKRTKAQGARLREGIHINRGLFALGNVISALVDGQRHVPYRDSKLTRLLQDSLGGNSRTVMLACISPADVNLDESVNTLRYADRARHIKNKPVVNRDPNAAALSHLRQQLAQLRAENNALRTALGPDANLQAILDAQMDSTSVAMVEELQQKIINLEVDLTKATMDLERERAARKAATTSLLEVQMDRDQCRLVLDELSIGDPKAYLEQQAQGAATPDALEILHARDNSEGSVLERMQQHYLARIATLEQQLQSEQALKNSLMLARNDSGTPDLGGLASLASLPATLSGDFSASLDMGDAMAAREQENLQDLLHKEQARRLITARLQEEMEQVTKRMFNKEKLIKEMQEQTGSLRLKEHYDKKLKDLMTELENAQKERAALIQKNAEIQSMSSEERRRVEAAYKERLAAMDDKIKRMKDKEAEYREMQKMKKQAETVCARLQSELLALKQQKITLQKKVEESQKDFLLWKQQHEREVQMLRKKGRRDAIELQKAEALAAKRLAILQRKSSEAEAARKRIKDLTERQSMRQRESRDAARSELNSAGSNGVVECQPNPDAPLLRTEKARREWVEEQLALCTQSQEYQKMMDGEIAERGEFSRQLREVQKKIMILTNDAPATPGLTPGPCCTPERSNAVKSLIREPIEKLRAKQTELEREINIRNKNIAELQAAWAAAKTDEESKGAGAADAKRWTGLRGILECREFLRTLFRTAHDYRTQSADWQLEAVRLQEELDMCTLKYDASCEEAGALKRRVATLLTMYTAQQQQQLVAAPTKKAFAPGPGNHSSGAGGANGGAAGVSPSGLSDSEAVSDYDVVAGGDVGDMDNDEEATTLLQRLSHFVVSKTRARRTDASEDESSKEEGAARRSLHNTLLDVPTRSPLQTHSTPVNAWQPNQPEPSSNRTSFNTTPHQEEEAPACSSRMDIDYEDDVAEDDDGEDEDDSDDPIYEPKRRSSRGGGSGQVSRTSSTAAEAPQNDRKAWEDEVLRHINSRAAQLGAAAAPRLTKDVLKDSLSGKMYRGQLWRPGRKTRDQMIMDYREIEGLDVHATTSSRGASTIDEPMQDASPDIPQPPQQDIRHSTSNASDLLPLDKHRELYRQQRRSQVMAPLDTTSSSSQQPSYGTSSPRLEQEASAPAAAPAAVPPTSPALMQFFERRWKSQSRVVNLRGGK